MKNRITALVIAPLVGAILGYLITDPINAGWFSSKWQVIESPPGNVHSLVAISKGSLWVQSDSGSFYYNENPSSCKTKCWQEVSGIPALPIIEPYESSVSNTPCASTPPLSRVRATVSECRREMWIDRNSTFALRNDGSIYLWQVDLAKEWSFLTMILNVCAGAIAMFIPTLIVILFSWLLNRIHKNREIKCLSLPNTACTGLVGFAPLNWVNSSFWEYHYNGVIQSHPRAANANR